MSAKQFTILQVFLLALLAFAATPAISHTFYVDPQSGASSGDGSALKPWKTLQQVIDSGKVETQQPASTPYQWGQPLKAKNAGAPVKAGDTLLLRTGYHGFVTIFAAYNSDFITIAAQSGNTPTASQIHLEAASKWVIHGLTVSPALAPTWPIVAAQSGTAADIINIESHSYQGPSRDITIDSCYLYSVLSTASWSMSDWNLKAANGIESNAIHTTLTRNVMTNVNFGIQMFADSGLVDHNKIDFFCGDGMRGTGNDQTFSYNWVQGSLQVNDNHCDCFQSWSVGPDGSVGTGVVERMTIIGNTCINYLDSNLAYQAQVQGISIFDGMADNWVVENNIVIVNQWNGIDLCGATNCTVVNNTVCSPKKNSPVGPPWIEVTSDKNGTISTNCVVRNNLTTDLQIEAGGQVTADHNIIMKDPSTFFANYLTGDVCPKTGCAAIAAGSPLLAPSVDIYGTPRPATPDIGAVQHTGATSVVQSTSAIRPALDFTASFRNGYLTLQLPAHTPNMITCTVSNLSGKVIMRQALTTTAGMAGMRIPENLAFSRGAYIVRLEGVNLDRSMSLVVR